MWIPSWVGVENLPEEINNPRYPSWPALAAQPRGENEFTEAMLH